MEIPPSSSFAQSSSYFSGLSKNDVVRDIFQQGLVSDRNSLLESSNRAVAASSTGVLQDFKYDDFREAYRMMNGPAKYPFQNIAQIENYKFDPYYFDGSENDPNINVNENLIGTPLGVSLLEDPRMSYVKNIMTMKEYEGQANQLNDSYIKELYMINSEKGSNYYLNMLDRQKDVLDNWSREGRKRKEREIPGIAFTYNLPAGVPNRERKRRNVLQTLYSETPSVQRNFRRERFLQHGNFQDEINNRNSNFGGSEINSDDDSQSIITSNTSATASTAGTSRTGVTNLSSSQNSSISFQTPNIIPPPNTQLTPNTPNTPNAVTNPNATSTPNIPNIYQNSSPVIMGSNTPGLAQTTPKAQSPLMKKFITESMKSANLSKGAVLKKNPTNVSRQIEQEDFSASRQRLSEYVTELYTSGENEKIQKLWDEYNSKLVTTRPITITRSSSTNLKAKNEIRHLRELIDKGNPARADLRRSEIQSIFTSVSNSNSNMGI
jgi:hypothetical protein